MGAVVSLDGNIARTDGDVGAVIAGRRTFDLAGGWDGDHHDGVPIFVPTHQAPPEPPKGNVQYVTDGTESCVVQAKAAAGERDVMLHSAHGAHTAQHERMPK